MVVDALLSAFTPPTTPPNTPFDCFHLPGLLIDCNQPNISHPAGVERCRDEHRPK
jgi:hypothetical protein